MWRQVFDMDRRQMMRMTRPLRALTPERRAPETADISISPEEAAEAVRQQAEVVNRLYLGLSSNSTNPQSTCLTDSNSPQTISKVPIRPRSKLLTQSGMKMMMQVPLVPRTITFDFEQQRKIM